ncbi:MAG: helicase-related protein [Acetobacteraceae bacterium]|nr:helicase-related protein [Acetobacteraceae bacterium]
MTAAIAIRQARGVSHHPPPARRRIDLLLSGLRVPVRREDVASGLAALSADPSLDDIGLVSVLAEAIRGRLRRAEAEGAMTHAERAAAEARLEAWRRQRLADLAAKARHRHEGEVVGALTLGRWVASFVPARSIRRRIVAFLGPTNSGKSHAAFDLLAAAPRGAYLAPLRLLAWEGQERLAERGVRASLLTGEERRIDPEATHVSATVEMADFVTPVPMAVVDEVQMLADEDRGWAWTQALVGLPAETLLVAGAAEAEPLIRRLAALTGEPLEVRRFERMVPLTVLRRPVPLARVEPGDALVCFSRRDAFALREALIARGRPPAMVYGALGPEVRRAEAERFRDGRAPVLVATDAIGMGLNLPIRRVLFAATTKYGGLGPHLIRQIAGRAGRYRPLPRGLRRRLGRGGCGADRRCDRPPAAAARRADARAAARGAALGDRASARPAVLASRADRGRGALPLAGRRLRPVAPRRGDPAGRGVCRRTSAAAREPRLPRLPDRPARPAFGFRPPGVGAAARPRCRRACPSPAAAAALARDGGRSGRPRRGRAFRPALHRLSLARTEMAGNLW